MNLKRSLGLAAVVLIPALSGCSNHAGVVRGQSPPDPLAGVPSPAAMQQMTHANYEHYPMSAEMGGYGCPTGDCYGSGDCYGYGYGGTGCDYDWMHDGGVGYGLYPNHRHSYSYKAPKRLVYPPANQPAAVVQYPYYTTKGPSDFFYGMR